MDPERKKQFERVCRENDLTPSQVVRAFVRDYIAAPPVQPPPKPKARSAKS